MLNERDRSREREMERYRIKDVYAGKCDVRLTAVQDSALNRLAERNGVSRSTIMRKAFDDFVKFNEDGAVTGEE